MNTRDFVSQANKLTKEGSVYQFDKHKDKWIKVYAET
jgi:hypothetical protein